MQIDNYGPWTVTPEPRRETDLQTLQSRLYADLAQLFGSRGGYVFFTRFDNMVAVSNGIDTGTHRHIQESVSNRYPVTVSLGIAAGSSPVDVLGTATELLQSAGSAQDSDRTEILKGHTVDEDLRSEEDLQIAHFDVDDATEKYTDQLNEFDTFINIERGYAELMQYMRRAHDSLSFFVGGDNIIAVCPALEAGAYHDAIDHVSDTVDVQLKVGVGRGKSAADAGMDAKHALEECRAEEEPVVLDT